MSQLNLFEEPQEEKKIVQILNGEYLYIPNFFDVPKANEYLKTFKENIIWKQESMKMYGKQVMFPRLTSWYGESDKPYTFSGITLQPYPWTKELMEIKAVIEPVCEVVFNSVLLNLYRDGNDSISWHTDAEKELGKNPLIASVNFGAERKFQIRHNQTQEMLQFSLHYK